MLLLLLPLVVLADDTDVSCTYKGVDFSALRAPADKPYEVYANNYGFKVNICREVKTTMSNLKGSAVTVQTGIMTYSGGMLRTQEFQSKPSGLTVTYKEGSQVTVDDTLFTQITLVCDESATSGRLGFDEFNADTGEIYLTLRHKAMCDLPDVTGSSGGLSGWAIAAIVLAVLLVLFVLVIAVWCAINFFVRGKRGVNILPLVEFIVRKNSGFQEVP